VAKRRKVSNLLALSLLNLLMQRPMYPYEMAATLRHRGKDQAIKINWGSLYTIVQNLEKYGFIEAVEVDREGRQPERTTYQITEAGRAELMDWLRELLGVPEREYTRFKAPSCRPTTWPACCGSGWTRWTRPTPRSRPSSRPSRPSYPGSS
jgi:DNA-binding PadR family transcriptional regulator